MAAAIRVVIPVASSARLIQCMDALFRSSIRPEFEVVVVSDGKDDLDDVLAPYEVTVVKATSTRNAGAARNQGQGTFTGDVLVFLDSDVIVEQTAIERLVAPIRNGTADAVVGTYSRDVEGLNFCEAYKQLYVSFAYSRRQGYLQGEFWSALAAIRNDAFSDLNGFSTAFTGATGEDTELGQRLSRRGYRILAAPGAQGKHLKKLNLVLLIRNDFRKGMKSLHLLLTSRSPVSGFRHSTSRDIGAVFTAYLLLVSAVLSIWVSPVFVLIAATSHLYSRSDLLSVYQKQGALFCMKSIPLTYVLDLVRGACVPLELARVCGERFALLLCRWGLSPGFRMPWTTRPKGRPP